MIVRRLGAGVAAAGLLAVSTVSPAGAAPPGPSVDYVQRTACIDAVAPPATVRNGVSWGQRALQYAQAWQYSRGAGVRVAVIDTGVNPGPAFGTRLEAGADLVQRTGTRPGLSDCDGHGTLVAGLIAAAPDERSGFTGVAPDATVVSVRQTSSNFTRPENANGGGTDAPGAGTPASLAAAVTYAAGTLRADVINISLAECQAAGNADDPDLTEAVRRAVQDDDAVVVSAAGNLSESGRCSTQNTPGKPPVTAATPADIELPGVLAVAAVGEDGAPASFSLAGSWVDIAAPGTAVIATNPYPGGRGQVDQVTTANGASGIQGTSFAAPYVAGVAALVRARYPQLSAAGVTQLLERTAAHPAASGGRDEYVGYGLVDPVAALSASQPLPAASTTDAGPVATALPVHVATAHSSEPRRTALWGALAAGGALVVLAVVLPSLRSRRSRRPDRSA